MNAKILETENVTVSFDGFKALNRLNFSMNVGELRVVIGPNGAGKTTFLDVITGKVQPTRGRVLFIQVTGNREQGTGYREQVTGYREQGTGNR
jgi:ABC-type uncharacterized transport system ATPase subunit